MSWIPTPVRIPLVALSMPELVYKPRGAARELFYRTEPEVLLEGPAGTGKTRALEEYANWYCETWPGSRVLFVRKTRKSMTESVLVTWEEKVLWPGHPAKVGNAGRENRTHYQYPNGSYIGLAGMDNADRIMSSEWDLACVFEGTELGLEEYEKILTRMRNARSPRQQVVVDCNPGRESHWLNQRAKRGKMVRLLSRHEDNPSLRPEYLESLRNLTGPRYGRLFLGKWVTEEGLVWEVYDPEVHLVSVVPELSWFFGSLDWGYRAPGCFQVWGVASDRSLYRVAEWYRTGENLEWWSERVGAAHREYGLKGVVADPSRPDSIDGMNRWLVGRGLAGMVMPADNRKRGGAKTDDLVGLDLVRWGFKPGVGYEPRLYLVRDALRGGVDEKLLEQGQPTGTEGEIEGYVWLKAKDGELVRDVTDPNVPDHGCLTGDSLVAMEDGGFLPLRHVKVGMRVKTPNGAGEVTACGVTKLDAELWVLELETGRKVLGTSDHPFWVSGRGWRPMAELQGGDEVAVLDGAGRRPAVGDLCRYQGRKKVKSSLERLVLEQVRLVRRLPWKAPVLNLTVSPQHVFFANGVLVSNCDAMRYAAMYAWRRDFGVEAKSSKPVSYPPGTLGHVLGHNRIGF